MSTSKGKEKERETENDVCPSEVQPKKKPRRVNKQKLNRAIRHDWMVLWYIYVVNIDMLKEAYHTPGSPVGFITFVQFLMDKARETMSRLVEYFGQTGGNVNNAHKDDATLLEMCKQCALNWKREWNLWKDSTEKQEWLASNEGAFIWRKFSSTDTLWETKRDKLAMEIEGWFNVVCGAMCRVVIQKDKHYMLDEPITEPCLTCISLNDIHSSWDDNSRIREDSHHDHHLVRFCTTNFIKFYGASSVYMAKRFKAIDLERHIMAQQRMFLEIQISGIRMCGLINPVAMINNDVSPILIFPYWNGGTLEDMLINMKNFQKAAKLGSPDAPEQKLQLFMENRLEIALALLETLSCMHSQGWLHNNLHARNILLHFPAWQWTKEGEPRFTGSSDLVFVGISNFGKACKTKHANTEWASKFHDWNWITKPCGPPRYIAPELYGKQDARNHSHWEGQRFYTEMTDMYAVGISIREMCKDYFAEWENATYVKWHDRFNHSKEFRERRGVESRLLHLLHRMAHPDANLRMSTKINTRQWIEDLGVNSQSIYRPLFDWSV